MLVLALVLDQQKISSIESIENWYFSQKTSWAATVKWTREKYLTVHQKEKKYFSTASVCSWKFIRWLRTVVSAVDDFKHFSDDVNANLCNHRVNLHNLFTKLDIHAKEFIPVDKIRLNREKWWKSYAIDNRWDVSGWQVKKKLRERIKRDREPQLTIQRLRCIH